MLNNPLLQQIQQISARLRTVQNPIQFMMQNYGANNPEFMNVLQDIQGKTPEQIAQYTRNRANAKKFDLQGFFNQSGINIR